MMPSFPFSPSPSTVGATTRVHKATNELLIAPDWTMNMEVCDFCNSNPPKHAKGVTKEVKEGLHHKNPKVQLLTLTLLETMVKNCGDFIHEHIGKQKILDGMIKIVKKKSDLHVRDKILVLLDSWQESFGGRGGKCSQYYWACDELRRGGILFPQRSQRSTLAVTPPMTHPRKFIKSDIDITSNSSKKSDQVLSHEVQSLSYLVLDSMYNAAGVLNDMLEAINPNDHMAVRDEVILELVDQCRSYQKKLGLMLTNTTDGDLLTQGVTMNESLQRVLAKHDRIARGNFVTNLMKSLNVPQKESMDSNHKTSEKKDENIASSAKASVSFALVTADQGEDKEEEDELTQLVQRRSKALVVSSHCESKEPTNDDAFASCDTNNALVLIDVPTPNPPIASTNSISTEEPKDLIDLFNTSFIASPTSTKSIQAPSSTLIETASEDSFSNYVAPWAQQTLPSPNQFQTQFHNVQSLPQTQSQTQHVHSQYPSYFAPSWNEKGHINYPNKGAWPTHNGKSSFQNKTNENRLIYSTAKVFTNSISPKYVNSSQNMSSSSNVSIPMQGSQTLQVTSYSDRTIKGTSLNGNVLVTAGSSLTPAGKKPYVPSYRLFEDLNVFGCSESEPKNKPFRAY